MNGTNLLELSPGSVVSGDGTRIGYLRLGHGPAVVLLHGSNESARSHLELARALADDFTVYLPDRRGRGRSGPFGPDYSMRSEVEDLAAVLAESGARKVFGVSVSALIALEAARTLPAIAQIAAYEPALLMDTGKYTDWVSRFDQELARGEVAAALITSLHGLDLAPLAFRLMPRWLSVPLTNMAMKSEDKAASSDEVTLRRLAPTIRYEGQLLAEMAGRLKNFEQVDADVLLLGGTAKRPAFIKPALDALAETLPHSQRIELPGLDHGGAADVSKINPGGRPDVVADAIRRFFLLPTNTP